MRAVRIGLSAVGWALLSALALAGVALSVLVAYSSTPAGRRVVASALIRIANAQVAGRLTLGGVDLQPGGAIAIRNFEAFDPDGRLVLQVDRLLVAADVTRIRNKVVGVDVEVDGAAVLMDEDGEGRLSLARAFAPAHPSPPSALKTKRPFWEDPLSGWTIRLRRLAVRDTDLWWQDAAGGTRVEAQDLSLDARGVLGPGRGRIEVALRGQSVAPAPGVLVFQTRALLDGGRLRVPVLRAQLGETALDGLAEADLERRVGRAALARAVVERQQARALVKGAPPGSNLALDAYADADGRVGTAAVHLEPQESGGGGGTGEAAVAIRLDGTRALGFDLIARALDPSALHAAAPAGNLNLSARGALAGGSLASARGDLDLDLAPSRLRAGEVGPAAAVVRLDRGSWEVSRLSLTAPGVRIDGSGSFKQGGAASAHLTAEIADLSRAGDNAGKLLGKPLPRLQGRARVEATLSGTAAAPVFAAQVASPSLGLGRISASGIEAQVNASGPFRPGQLRLQAQVQRLAYGDRPVAQGLALDGAVTPSPADPSAAAGALPPKALGGTGLVDLARLSASGLVPSLGKEPVSLEAAATLPRDHRTLRLTSLSLIYPGTHYVLESPATLTFEGPRVDRLSLAAGPRRISVEGGIGPRKALDARLELVKVDLAKLPAGLLPAQERIAGEVSADARATGTLARPHLDARVEIQGGGFRTERALALKGSLRYDGGARRAVVQVGVTRGAGGTVDLDADLPVPFRGRASEPVAATLRADALLIPPLLDLAGAQLPISGLLAANARLSGTAGAPTVHAKVSVAGGTFRDLEGIAIDATADLAGAADLAAEVRLAERPAVKIQARAPVSLAALLAEPGRTLRGLGEARISADASLPALELAALSGRLGIPSGMRGQVTGEVHAAGRPGALRGTAALALADGAYAGYTGVSARLEAAARDDRVEARIAAQLQGRDLLQLTAALRAPPERLATRGGLDAAGLSLDATVPGVDLEHASAPSGVALNGLVDLELHGEGTLGRPVLQMDGSGRSVRIKGRPVGQIRLSVRAAGDRATAELVLDPPAGGKLTATAAVNAPISIDLRAEALWAAPAQLKVRADGVDLGFVPAILPTVVRSAVGKLDADVTASGPLAQLSPRGTARLTGGRLGLLEYGEWAGISLDAAATEDAIEIRTLEARRGEGTLQVRAALRGLTAQSAQLDGRLEVKKLTISRGGTDLGTVTVGVKASGTYKDRRLEARLDVPEGLVRLADKLPRELQSLEKRPDIVVGPRPPPKKASAAPAPASEAGKPITAAVRLVAPGGFRVQRLSPRVNVELKADVTYEHQAGGDLMSGSVQVVRGFVEPLSDRRFEVKRARLTFTGGPPKTALIDAEAVYQSTSANVTVTVTVSGPISKPEFSLKSQPPMDESRIAMLIATGQTELRAGGGGAAGAAQNDVSRTAAQKLGFAVFNTFIRDQIPFATGDVSLDASAAKVSGYIPGTKIYVGFTRRFDANRQQGENEDEVRMEYAVTPHWTLEGRWGNANTGGASLIWSKDY